MVWQCDTCFVGEDGQIGEHRDRYHELGGGRRPFDFHLRTPMREITGPNEDKHHRCPDPDMGLSSPIDGHTGVKYSLDEALMDTNWYALLQEYSKRTVNNPVNILPYLSPFARRIHKQTNAKYLAGLWALDGQIPFRSLLWYCKKRGRPASNGSPSWSWSSVFGEISHPGQWMYRMHHPGAQSEWLPRNVKEQDNILTYPHPDSQVQCLSSKTEMVTSNAFGAVRNGELEITGLVHSYAGPGLWDFSAERNPSRKMSTRFSTRAPGRHLVGGCTVFSVGSTASEATDEQGSDKEDAGGRHSERCSRDSKQDDNLNEKATHGSVERNTDRPKEESEDESAKEGGVKAEEEECIEEGSQKPLEIEEKEDDDAKTKASKPKEFDTDRYARIGRAKFEKEE